MKSTDYLRWIGAVVIGAAVLIAILIPVEWCGNVSTTTNSFDTPTFAFKCISASFASRLTAWNFSVVGTDYRWPLRLGVLAVGAVAALLLFRRAEDQDRGSV